MSYKNLSCLMSYAGFLERMAVTGSYSASSLSEEEHAVLGASDPINTPMMVMTYGEEPKDDSDNIEPDYTPVEHPSELAHSPDYTPDGIELLSYEYEPDEDEEDPATSLEISSRFPTPLHRYFITHTSTQVKRTLRKTIVIPSWKRAASPPESSPPTKEPYGDTTWMPQIRS